MSQQFCITHPVNIEDMAFKLLTLFDAKVNQSAWDAVEVVLQAELLALEATADSLTTTIAALNRQLIYLHYKITELGG
jgi:hypothetical protein